MASSYKGDLSEDLILGVPIKVAEPFDRVTWDVVTRRLREHEVMKCTESKGFADSVHGIITTPDGKRKLWSAEEMPARLTSYRDMVLTERGHEFPVDDIPSLPDDERWGICVSVATRKAKSDEVLSVRFQWLGGPFLRITVDVLKNLDPEWGDLDGDILTLWGLQLELLMFFPVSQIYLAHRITPFDGLLLDRDIDPELVAQIRHKNLNIASYPPEAPDTYKYATTHRGEE